MGITSSAGRKVHGKGLSAPFPWFGGKRRWANAVWDRFGDPDVFAEPFAGSLAVLLHRVKPCGREIVTDTDGHISNFWRALRDAPLDVARHADHPTIHHDLLSRRHWLADWGRENSERLCVDDGYYDAKAAGYWVWCVSQWIGGTDDMLRPRKQKYPPLRDQIPHVSAGHGGQGVQRQRIILGDTMPMVVPAIGGRGVTRQCTNTPTEIPNGERLHGWFLALAARLSNVVVLNRSWEWALTPTVLGHVTDRRGSVKDIAVFMDPPYVIEGRTGTYASDNEGVESVNKVAKESYAWAVEHGERIRIAYCATSDDFPLPDGWTYEERPLPGIRNREERQRGTIDRIMFSPACEDDEQASMF